MAVGGLIEAVASVVALYAMFKSYGEVAIVVSSGMLGGEGVTGVLIAIIKVITMG